MIDLKIAELFSTIGVGLTAPLPIVYFYFLLRKLFWIRKFNDDAFVRWLRSNFEKDFSKSGYSFVVTVLVFALGVLTLDLTDYMADSSESANPMIGKIQQWYLIKNEAEIRRSVLIKNERELTGLGAEAFSSRDIASVQKNGGSPFSNVANVKEAWAANGAAILTDTVERKALTGTVNSIYYEAKNWCYLKSPPAKEELSSVQHHIDFTRSIAIISLLTLVAITFIFITYFIKELARGKKRFTVMNDGILAPKIFVPRLSLFVLVPAFFIAIECHFAAEKNFDERAMGYYFTQLSLVNRCKGVESKPAEPIPAGLVQRKEVKLSRACQNTIITSHGSTKRITTIT